MRRFFALLALPTLAAESLYSHILYCYMPLRPSREGAGSVAADRARGARRSGL